MPSIDRKAFIAKWQEVLDEWSRRHGDPYELYPRMQEMIDEAEVYLEVMESEPSVPSEGHPMPPFEKTIKAQLDNGTTRVGDLSWECGDCYFTDEDGRQWAWEFMRRWWPIEEPTRGI